MYILGLTTLSESAASLIRDGDIVAAAEEERFSRRKHHIGFPYQAVEYCLREAGITIADVAHIGLYWKPWLLRQKIVQTVKSLAMSPAMFRARVARGMVQVGDSYPRMLRYPHHIRQHFGPGTFKFHFLEHHLCHAASTFFASPFDRAAILTMDGAGEEATTLFAVGDGTHIRPFKRIKLPHSLGQFYSAVTNFLGFDMLCGDEWKVMGLAAYGEPEFYDFFSRRVLTLNGKGDFHFNIRLLDHHLAKRYQFSSELSKVLGPPRQSHEDITPRHQNIAASAQLAFEEAVLHLLGELYERTHQDNLCLAGGCALNSVANGRIMNEGPFRQVFIQPAAGDAGCSLGAALLIHHQLLGEPRRTQMQHAYYGPSYDSEQCAAALRRAGLSFETLPDKVLLPRVAAMIAEGSIVGWFQGRMEFGPRALGNRSFLADPRRADMRELLNQKVKLREWFRPLAPSMLEEVAADVFGRPHHDPFMITVLAVADGQQARTPAVVHVDGTARPQTVSRNTNPRYWQLIREFQCLTGVPMLLNTSFNIQEPIVCSPEDAIKTFQGASFDALVLENHLVRREPHASLP